jgi:hypothetical protein
MRNRSILNEDQICPICSSALVCEKVDVGVGMISGNLQCIVCGWTPEQDDVTYGSKEVEDDLVLV